MLPRRKFDKMLILTQKRVFILYCYCTTCVLQWTNKLCIEINERRQMWWPWTNKLQEKQARLAMIRLYMMTCWYDDWVICELELHSKLGPWLELRLQKHVLESQASRYPRLYLMLRSKIVTTDHALRDSILLVIKIDNWEYEEPSHLQVQEDIFKIFI